MSWENTLRKTGRTSRMLNAAIAEAKAGRAVYVVASDIQHAQVLANYIEAACPEMLSGIKIETPEALGFSWDTLTVRGSHPNCLFLVDHYTITRRFDRILALFHMWGPQ